MTTVEILKKRGYTTVPSGFYAKTREWMEWYQGDVKSFHHYRVRNGQTIVNCTRYTLGMAKKVSEDWANLLLNERVKITLEGEAEQSYVDKVLAENNFWVKGNESQELAFALGTVAFVPRVVGAKLSSDGSVSGGSVEIDYVTVEHIFPLSWRNGIVTECAFDSAAKVDGKSYTYLQIHRKGENGLYIIESKLFDDKGEEVNMAAVPGYDKVPPVVYTKSDRPQFVIDRPNIVNNVDPSLPLGISVYANSIDALKGVDIAYDSYVNEFVLGKKRIMVKPTATSYISAGGENVEVPVFDANDTTYYVLPEDMEDGAVIHEIDMTLRTQEHSTGIRDNLNMLSSKCGFGENYYRFTGSITTATQVISENSTMFRTIKKHEIVLESVLENLCRTILRLGKSTGMALKDDVKITINFDDSIIEDKTTERNNDRQDLAAGIMNDWEYRAKYYGEDEATAKAMLPRVQDMTTELQNEVE